MACDLRIATPQASFGIPAGRLGLAVDGWTVERLSLIAGAGLARAMLLAAEVVKGDEAHRLGFVQRLGGLDDALAWADEVAALAPLTLRAHKAALEGRPGATDAGGVRTRAWASDDLRGPGGLPRPPPAPVPRPLVDHPTSGVAGSEVGREEAGELLEEEEQQHQEQRQAHEVGGPLLPQAAEQPGRHPDQAQARASRTAGHAEARLTAQAGVERVGRRPAGSAGGGRRPGSGLGAGARLGAGRGRALEGGHHHDALAGPSTWGGRR